MTHHYPARELALQRCEPQRAAAVVSEHELHGCVAQAAHAVIKEHRSLTQQGGDVGFARAHVAS